MIRAQRAHMFITAQSHPGMTGKNNEDNFGVSAFTLNEHNPMPVVFAVVSDGIGGHKAGEIASEMVVNLVSQEVEASNGGNPQAVFQQSFYKASEAVYKAAQEDATRKGMGATVACALVIGAVLYIAYAGDSRIYLMRGKKIRQLSRDHTWVQEAIEKGVLDKSKIKNHPNLHVIRRYIGSNEPPEPDLRLFLRSDNSDEQARKNQGYLLHPGDVVLLCSDGLTDLVNDVEIVALAQQRPLEKAAKAMIDLANERGGHDNITVVMLQLPEDYK